jgi:hypothetical protein
MKVYTEYDKIQMSDEMCIFIGIRDIHVEHWNYNQRGESMFKGVRELCQDLFEFVDDPASCDVVALPHRFQGAQDPVLQKLASLDKPLVCFYNDDDTTTHDLPANVVLYRSSMFKSNMLPNERSMPVFTADCFVSFLQNPVLSVGFCGQVLHGRLHHLKKLHETPGVTTDYIFRSGFWAPGVDRALARQEFIENMHRNVFTFCFRGNGNFSYRLFETLMMGRIPVLVDTDCVYPPGDFIFTTPEGLVDFYRTRDLLAVQRHNREVYLSCMCPLAFVRRIKNDYTFSTSL